MILKNLIFLFITLIAFGVFSGLTGIFCYEFIKNLSKLRKCIAQFKNNIFEIRKCIYLEKREGFTKLNPTWINGFFAFFWRRFIKKYENL